MKATTMPEPIQNFEFIERDGEYDVRDLGSLTYKGVTMQVELHAFVNEDTDYYDYDGADLMLVRDDETSDEAWNELMGETYLTGGLLSALQTFMDETLEGENNVCWGESGAQNSDNLAFGRNNW